MGKKNSFQNKQPIDGYPFEGFYNGSWCNVEQLSIKDGKITTHYEDHGTITEERVPATTLRIRSRKANMCDCLFFLRTGVHVCVLVNGPMSQQAWVDAKINSIESLPHKFGCKCRFNVSLLEEHLPSQGQKKKVTDEIREVSIDNIKVLQQLARKPSEDPHFRWISSRDCLWVHEAKLFRSQFMHDILWFLVASTLKRVEFVISSAQNKILYEVLDGDPVLGCLRSGKIVKAVNFKFEDGVSKPIITTFVLSVPTETPDPEETIKEKSIDVTEGGAVRTFSLDDSISLRRSKRRKMQPEFFVGEGGFLNAKSHVTRARTASVRKKEEANSSLIDVDVYELDSDYSINSNCTEEVETEHRKRVRVSTENNMTVDIPVLYGQVEHSVCVPLSKNRDLEVENHRKAQTTATHKKEIEENKEAGIGQTRDRSQRSGDNPIMCGSHETTSACKEAKVKQQQSNYLSEKGTINKSIVNSYSTSVPNTFMAELLHEVHVGSALAKQDHVANQNRKFSITSSKKVKSCPTSVPNLFMAESLHEVRVGSALAKQDRVANQNKIFSITSSKKVKSGSKKNPSTKQSNKLCERVKKVCSAKRCRSSSHSKRVYLGADTYRRRFLTQSESKELIERCMKNINSEISKHQQSVVQQWEEILSYKWWKLPQTPPSDDPVENPELEDMWKEMNSLQFHEENSTAIVEIGNNPSKDDGKFCQHEYVLNEEIGTICRCCRSVGTEIRHILPSFLNSTGRVRVVEYDHMKLEGGYMGPLSLNLLDKTASERDLTVLDENECVWSLIPNLRDKLHIHQKNAFEFIWKNIAGSLMPSDMDASSKKTGGCVIAHSPGAGKSFLMISFIVSYLKLFPAGRPLILAPKTTLHAWYKEFKKWEVSLPVYEIQARGNYRKEIQKKKGGKSPEKFKVNQYAMHTLDCLEKFEKWHHHSSVLLMSYPSFLSIMRGSSVLENWGYLANILMESPGLLILDEGHNPRSSHSMLRKKLMKVKTKQRILLSGTLFQNTFEEYFNTLSLARPGFISEILRALDPSSRKNRYKEGCLYKEKRARKFFLEEIANRINSGVEEEKRMGLNLLKRITSGFIDVYEGVSSERLPGLENYMLLLKPTVLQQEFLATVQKNGLYRRYPLDVELLITLVSIHPWLVTRLKYSNKHYSPEKLEELKRYKLDVTKGSKVRFIVNLVSRCLVKREKVLIFSRYKDPIWLCMEIFENIFGWEKGNEVLELHGDQDLSERSRMIDKFEDPGGSAQVLIASISACSEGISLTAASRVVFMDSEWNPSRIKQAVARAYRPGQERVVYVYQLLASGTMEEDKYRKNTWKENVSRMISVGEGTEDASCMKPEDIDDEVMKEIVDTDNGQSIQMVMKDENLFGRTDGGREAALLAPSLLTFS
ncbi:SNF2 domain-containing protein CLASSY [Ranunculus cassubicifolius]